MGIYSGVHVGDTGEGFVRRRGGEGLVLKVVGFIILFKVEENLTNILF